MVGITSYGAYIPIYRLARKDIGAMWGKGSGSGDGPGCDDAHEHLPGHRSDAVVGIAAFP